MVWAALSPDTVEELVLGMQAIGEMAAGSLQPPPTTIILGAIVFSLVGSQQQTQVKHQRLKSSVFRRKGILEEREHLKAELLLPRLDSRRCQRTLHEP